MTGSLKIRTSDADVIINLNNVTEVRKFIRSNITIELYITYLGGDGTMFTGKAAELVWNAIEQLVPAAIDCRKDE